VRTVISSIGVNLRDVDASSGNVIGTLGQGALLTVLRYSDRTTGWYRVRGETLTGWISADPDLTATGRFNKYQSTARGFNALYPQSWTFSDTSAVVIFRPQSGQQSIFVKTAPSVSALGPPGRQGYVSVGSQDVVVCGVTGSFTNYEVSSGVTPPPVPRGQPPALFGLSQIRLKLDTSRALEMDYNWATADQLLTFRNFYDSVTFPSPQCQRQASSASASASPSASPSASF
jgi:hypothetical protein